MLLVQLQSQEEGLILLSMGSAGGVVAGVLVGVVAGRKWVS
ncbi:MAG: hypothetical protein ACTSWP_01170 [Candidatus Freyarchaeota archaeon]|nr:hypothetical protein [Candidatus Freyrarchaeum guaymaensis]